ncbi:hypothetical protein [Agrococcus sp. ARC_14]|uniref:FUSC family protein n=1 Tax=Agrococcus sp. ARC_14 TaxID=2919927 RepID=UPI001F06C637|nr:hypothetical protein [Agrococcus sp. ARC_14]MCH1881448.1 hypothetical protein [Agrococcus sp. ARC_14]
MDRPQEPPEPAARADDSSASGDRARRVIGSITPQAKEGAKVAKSEVKRALPLYRVAIAVRTALAAMLAWLIGNQMGGELPNYAYAAPLGAFVAVGTTVFTIGRTALQQVIGMTGGAALGLLTIALEWNGILEIGLIGVVAVLLQGVPRFSQGASVVPVVAVLVILFGGANPDGYAIGYVGQFALGMGVGVAVNALVLPALYDRETRREIRAAVADLAARVDVLAETMRGDWPPEREDWAGWGPELQAEVDRLDHQVVEAREARRFNVRMLWHRHDLDVDERAMTALRAVVHRMEDVLSAVASTAWERPVGISIEHDERQLAADAMGALAAHMHAWHARGDAPAASAASGEAIDALYRRVIDADEPQSGLASVVFALRAIRERIDWAVSQDPEA